MSNVIKGVIKNILRKKRLGLDKFTAEFFQTFKEELSPSLLKLLLRIERKETLPKSFY
jgi:hypothetical protein